MKSIRHPISARLLWAATAVVLFISMIFTNTGLFDQLSAGAEDESTSIGELVLNNLEVYVNGILLSEDGDASQATVSDGDTVTISFDWSIINNTEDEDGNRILVYSVELSPSGILFTDSGDVVSYEGNSIGKYVLENNVFTIYLDEEATADKSNIGGGAYIEGSINLDGDDTLDDGSEQTIGVADKTYKVTFDSESDTGTAAIEKSASGSVTKQSDGNLYTGIYDSCNSKRKG
ncbi:MAG: hypothetical protein LUE12_00820 [Ruminococcus sp.]|nr:hypothetical protein [Ruminococcus sp.]